MNKFLKDEILPIVESICSLRLKTHVLLTTLFGGFTVGMITGVIENWIFEPYVAFVSLIGIIMADHLSGMYLAWKGNRFETKKAARILWTLVAHTTLLVGATGLSSSDGLYWLNEAVFTPLSIFNLLSLVKNLALLGLIKKEVVSVIYNKVDLYKDEYSVVKDKSTANANH
jgi:hypothetical protein